MTANAATGRLWSGLASSDPTPIAKTITDSTMDACVTELPTR